MIFCYRITDQWDKFVSNRFGEGNVFTLYTADKEDDFYIDVLGDPETKDKGTPGATSNINVGRYGGSFASDCWCCNSR